MDNELVNKLIEDLNGLKDEKGKDNLKKLDSKTLGKVLLKAASFAGDCEECREFMEEAKVVIADLKDRQARLRKTNIMNLQQKTKAIVAHLQKKHKLVREGHYLSLYMSLGMCFGLVFGLFVFEQYVLGLPIGMCIGIAIGSARDAEAKNKGLTI